MVQHMAECQCMVKDTSKATALAIVLDILLTLTMVIIYVVLQSMTPLVEVGDDVPPWVFWTTGKARNV